jgi:GNAT superfamily N-acetyltransferase
MSSTIVQLPSTQVDKATEVLSAAFGADPVVNYFLPEAAIAKQKALQLMAECLLKFGQPYQQIYTTGDVPKGIAIWLPPEASSFQWPQLWQLMQTGLFKLPFYARCDRMIDLLGYFVQEINQQQQMTEPFWYLMLLGVAPGYQNQGIGGALLQPVLEQADRDQTLCLLETSTTAAVRFYQRQGFEIMHTRQIGQSLPYWTLKRNPK